MTPAISFIIPVRNDARGLGKCLRSIAVAADAAAATVECIVVDNGSTDDSPRVAREAQCRVLSVPGERVGSLRNRAAAVASSSLLAFIDADHEIGPGWISAAQQVMSDPTVSATGAPCRAPHEATWVQRSYDALRDHRDAAASVEWLGGGNMIVRAETFHRIGGFDAGLEACEDVDLCRRIREAKGRIVSDPRLENVHHGDPRTLRALFRGELWRGRNNLQVSLRERPSLRALPSILIPVFQLCALAVAPILAAASLAAAASALTIAALPSIARAVRMQHRAPVPLPEAVAVAVTYDSARALALLLRVGHRRAQPSPLVASR